MVRTTLKIGPDRAKAIPMPEQSLFNKLDRVIKLKPERGATVGGNPKGCQGTECDLHVEVPSDRPHARIETSTNEEKLLTKS